MLTEDAASNNQDHLPLIKASVPVLSLKEVYAQAGGFGKQQWIIVLFVLLCLLGPNLFIQNLVYFEIKPEYYTCTLQNGTVFSCNLDRICNETAPALSFYEVDSNYKHVKNLITDFGITCQSKFGIGLLGSMYFLGEAMGSLFYTTVGTYIQKTRIKHLMFKNVVLMLILNLLVLLMRSLQLLYFSIFIIGVCQSI